MNSNWTVVAAFSTLEEELLSAARRLPFPRLAYACAEAKFLQEQHYQSPASPLQFLDRESLELC